MKEKNIFIRTLELGVNNPHEGVTYNEAKGFLEKELDIVLTPTFEDSYVVWFFENFYHPAAQQRLIQNSRNQKGAFMDFLNDKAFIKGDSQMKYLEYQEYQFAVKSAVEAKISARNALIISSILAFTSIVVGVLQLSTFRFPLF